VNILNHIQLIAHNLIQLLMEINKTATKASDLAPDSVNTVKIEDIQFKRLHTLVPLDKKKKKFQEEGDDLDDSLSDSTDLEFDELQTSLKQKLQYIKVSLYHSMSYPIYSLCLRRS
jgi:hypothetical protein